MTAFQKSVSMGDLLNMLDAILNRGITFDDNVDCRRVSVTSHGTPGRSFRFRTRLGKCLSVTSSAVKTALGQSTMARQRTQPRPCI